MNIANDSLILIADGQKALFLRNDGDEKYLNLVVETKEEIDNPPNREQAANRRGRMFDGNDHKSAVDDTDWHQLAKERFATDISELLYKRAHRGDFERLVVVASPQALGELRQNWHKEVRDKIIGEIDKDLTNHPIEEIEKQLSAVSE
jgi:protein required for attachment to host cells